ncbi:MAG: methylated-DNA--[protein]-cysteine S-methyltransferase [Candidatus Jidaibacter sp.]|jgi:AraC family transcriptional regulator of adaptative response/methylated-DNA-[protein]-cysteine methyltransferase|nr:methylated-DNA--[protein]-cysteine S-methyltransferase [Candidatus Jidaibacter sp.]
MSENKQKLKYYKAFLSQNPEYEGVFYVGTKTTKKFCSATCTKRKPKFENCEFFESIEDALAVSYEPCQYCRPTEIFSDQLDLIDALIEKVNEDLDKKWSEDDFHALKTTSTIVRKKFKKCLGMTFTEYVRARKLGAAVEKIISGKSFMDEQLSIGYDPSSGFRDLSYRKFGLAPNLLKPKRILRESWISTRFGAMIAISDEKAIFFLAFVDRKDLELEIERVKVAMKAIIIPGVTQPLELLQKELNSYFKGSLKNFRTPIAMTGSKLQKKIWHEIYKIPYGKLATYSEVANSIGKGKAVRAIASLIGKNPISIIVPCHRVINSTGSLGGYNSGVIRKQWLINLEKRGMRDLENRVVKDY